MFGFYLNHSRVLKLLQLSGEKVMRIIQKKVQVHFYHHLHRIGQKHVQHLQKTYKSKKWSVANMSSLLDETALQRRQWIMEDSPVKKRSPKLVVHTISCFITIKKNDFDILLC